MLQGWLTEDAGLLSVMDTVIRAAKEWHEHGRNAIWLTHTTGRLAAAEQVLNRPDLAASLEQRDRDYLTACREAERRGLDKARAAARNRQRLRAFAAILLCGFIAGLLGWINQSAIKQVWNWYAVMRPYMNAHVRPYALSEMAERALRPKSTFQECDKDCPEMVALPPGAFTMGSSEQEKGHSSDENPQHAVTVPNAFAISKYLVTFDDWDACVKVGGCPPLSDGEFGRGKMPVVNVNWNDARQYVAWLSLMTGKWYRLLTEAEWEYAERAGTTSAYFWGDEVGIGNAVCIGCGSKWDNKQTAPVGSFQPNGFGLYDMLGNVWEWTEDCYHDSLDGAPTDGSAWTDNCKQGRRAVRGGGWDSYAVHLRSADRDRISIGTRINDLGFRVARTLKPGAALSSAPTATLPGNAPAAHRRKRSYQAAELKASAEAAAHPAGDQRDRNSTIATKNTILAIPTAAPAMPPKPRTAAIKAMISSVTTRFSIDSAPRNSFAAPVTPAHTERFRGQVSALHKISSLTAARRGSGPALRPNNQ